MSSLLAICILRREPSPATILCAEYDVSSFSFFKRSSVQEFLGFFACTLSEKTKCGTHQVVEQDIYIGCSYTDVRGLTGVIITQKDYPQRVAITLMGRILDEFCEKHTRSQWILNTPSGIRFPQLKEYLSKYQNPNEIDSIMKVQKELDETKLILHKTIESLLARGEKLDNLVDKSERLSAQSKSFYKVAKKTNACSCSIL